MYIVVLKFVYILVYIPRIVKREIKRNVLIYKLWNNQASDLACGSPLLIRIF